MNLGTVRLHTANFIASSNAALLDDPDFPKHVLSRSKNIRIRLFEMLFEKYSKLFFTKDTDRSVAISGLEKRLARIFETEGGYGAFKRYLHRSLLWQRSGGKRLERINYPEIRKVPSWSWMAYKGGICYMPIPFGEVDWSDDVRSYFMSEQNLKPGHYQQMDSDELNIELRAPVKGLLLRGNSEERKQLIFDDPEEVVNEKLRYIVIGKERSVWPSNEQKHYILVVMLSSSGNYTRVGVGFLQKRLISPGYEDLEAVVV
jgi:hypothetical protein